MLNGTFLIDWVFIDSVIIILLFLLLFSVRIFKNTHRWRSTYSNEALKRLACPQMLDSVKYQSFRNVLISYAKDEGITTLSINTNIESNIA